LFQTDSEYEDEKEKEKSVEGVRTLFAYHLFSTKQYQESMSHFLALKTNPYDVIKQFPDLLPASAPRPSNPKLTDRELEQGLSALIDYLTEVCYSFHMPSGGVICKIRFTIKNRLWKASVNFPHLKFPPGEL